MWPGYLQRGIEENWTKTNPSCLIPHLLVVFTRQLEILETTLLRRIISMELRGNENTCVTTSCTKLSDHLSKIPKSVLPVNGVPHRPKRETNPGILGSVTHPFSYRWCHVWPQVQELRVLNMLWYLPSKNLIVIKSEMKQKNIYSGKKLVAVITG